MAKRLKEYLVYLENMAACDMSSDEIKEAIEDIKVNISFFQHERLIHLIVTLAFALFSFISLFTALITENIAVMFLFLVLLGLTVPYIFHYYKLENGVQKIYTYYDLLKNMKSV